MTWTALKFLHICFKMNRMLHINHRITSSVFFPIVFNIRTSGTGGRKKIRAEWCLLLPDGWAIQKLSQRTISQVFIMSKQHVSIGEAEFWQTCCSTKQTISLFFFPPCLFWSAFLTSSMCLIAILKKTIINKHHFHSLTSPLPQRN